MERDCETDEDVTAGLMGLRGCGEVDAVRVRSAAKSALTIAAFDGD